MILRCSTDPCDSVGVGDTASASTIEDSVETLPPSSPPKPPQRQLDLRSPARLLANARVVKPVGSEPFYSLKHLLLTEPNSRTVWLLSEWAWIAWQTGRVSRVGLGANRAGIMQARARIGRAVSMRELGGNRNN